MSCSRYKLRILRVHVSLYRFTQNDYRPDLSIRKPPKDPFSSDRAVQDGPWGRRRWRGPRVAAWVRRGRVTPRRLTVGGLLHRYPFPVLFSSCSRKDLEASLEKGVGVCLFNLPDVRQSSGGRKCGNGYVEEGEQCDCGEPEVRTSASHPVGAKKREWGRGSRTKALEVRAANVPWAPSSEPRKPARPP